MFCSGFTHVCFAGAVTSAAHVFFVASLVPVLAPLVDASEATHVGVLGNMLSSTMVLVLPGDLAG